MEKWLEAYAQWPPGNQLIFSCVSLLAFLVVLFLFGIWAIQLARYAAITVRGWPPAEAAEKGETPAVDGKGREILVFVDGVFHRTRPLPVSPPFSPDFNLRDVGIDWKKEQAAMAEEARLVQDQQARLQQEMDQQATMQPAGKKPENPENPCTNGAAGGHTNKGAPA